MSTTLDTLSAGQRARILEIVGDDGIAIRLMEMGLIDGEEIEVIGFAPWGDPMEILARGYRLSLRGNEAKRVVVELIGDFAATPEAAGHNPQATEPA